AIRWSANIFTIETQGLGTGSADRGILIRTNGNGPIQFNAGGAARLFISPAGQLLWNTDNALDIGASATGRPRTGYFGTSVVTPALGSGGASSINFTTSGGIQFNV